jgi:hypothetical protein
MSEEVDKKATKKGDDVNADKGRTPDSGAQGGDASPGDAPMGGGGQRHNPSAGSKGGKEGGRDARER